MKNVQAIHNAIGVVGNVISAVLFLSPAPTFYRICKQKDVEQFQYYPYLVSVMNCMFWVFYGMPFVTPNSIPVISINAAGLVLELIYLGIYCYYDREKKGRKRVLCCLLGGVVLMAAIVLTAMLGFPQKKRSLFVGIFCDVFNIAMYVAPLAVMKKVIRTKSVEYMPLPLSLACFFNGLIWTAYAIVIFDWFILISNSLGLVSCVLQLSLYAWYWRRTPVHHMTDVEAVTTKPSSEIQLAAASPTKN